MYICINLKQELIISSALWVFGRRSRKLGPTQGHAVVCWLELGRDSLLARFASIPF